MRAIASHCSSATAGRVIHSATSASLADGGGGHLEGVLELAIGDEDVVGEPVGRIVEGQARLRGARGPRVEGCRQHRAGVDPAG
jgi:hypothetical protein